MHLISNQNTIFYISDKVKHLPYEEGASMYVSKFICDGKIDYGFIKK